MGRDCMKLIEQMRLARDQRENEVKAPVIEALNHERRQKEEAVRAYKEIEFKLGQDVINMAMDQAKHEIARNISEQFAGYMHKAGAYDDEGDWTFKVSKRYARMAMPDKMMQDVLREYQLGSRPRLKIVDSFTTPYAQTIQIKIPALAINVNLIK